MMESASGGLGGVADGGPALRHGTREAGMQRLEEFLPMAADYARWRNFDLPGHPSVSHLSPYLSRRLLTEAEVWRAVRARYSHAAAEKFLQEVAWRTYWKGWLEMRPTVWTDYRQRVGFWEEETGRDTALAERRRAAEQGQTGLECFDHWSRELTATGYLHNHARMWFASIWIFTLQLPWAGGAEFFYRQLLDADAASNTLSWRWVAGWQTPGKHYLARAENIHRFTEGRFNPAGQLRESAPPVPMEKPLPPPDASQLPQDRLDAVPPKPMAEDGLLCHVEDLRPERFFLDLHSTAPRRAAILPPPAACAGKAGGDQALAQRFQTEAARDTRRRWGKISGAPMEQLIPGQAEQSCPTPWIAATAGWARRERLRRIWTPYAPVGEVKEQLQHLRAELEPSGIELRYLLSPWDAILWPHATKGFFPFREKIRAIPANPPG